MNSPFFDWVLAASLRASLLTAVVLLAQTLLRRRLSASWRHALWLPVLVVLLTPSFPESRWSVGSLLRLTRAPLAAPAPQAVDPSSRVPLRVSAAPPRQTPVPWREIAVFTWLLGAAGLGGIGLATFLQTLRRFRRSRLPLSGALREAVAAAADEVGLSKVPRIWMGSAIQSPAVTGLFRPVLLLPADFAHTLSPEETRLVLRHELTHIRRGDLPLNALLCLLLTLHWFNPVLWFAFFKSRQDREAACDARVLQDEATPLRVAYGHTLLKVETAFRHPGLGLGFVGIFQNSAALRSRIESLLNQPNPDPLMKTTLSISLAVLTVIGVTRAATPDSAPPQAAPKPAPPAAPQTRGVLLPKVQFRNTPINEAIDFFRVATRDLDPQKKGLNIVVKPGGIPDARISLELANIPANEALHYCAQLAGYTLSFDGGVAVLTPFTAATTESARTTGPRPAERL